MLICTAYMHTLSRLAIGWGAAAHPSIPVVSHLVGLQHMCKHTLAKLAYTLADGPCLLSLYPPCPTHQEAGRGADTKRWWMVPGGEDRRVHGTHSLPAPRAGGSGRLPAPAYGSPIRSCMPVFETRTVRRSRCATTSP